MKLYSAFLLVPVAWCQDPCQTAPCANAGTCVATGTADEFECICPVGFLGDICDTSVSEYTSEVRVIGNSRKVRFSSRDDPSNFFDVVFDSWREMGCDGVIDQEHSFNAFQDFTVLPPTPGRIHLSEVSTSGSQDSSLETTTPTPTASEDSGELPEDDTATTAGSKLSTQDEPGDEVHKSSSVYADTMLTTFMAPLSRPGNNSPTFGTLQVDIHEVGNIVGAPAGKLEWLGETLTLRSGSIKITVSLSDYSFNQKCSDPKPKVEPENEPGSEDHHQGAVLGLIIRTPDGRYDVSDLTVDTDSGTFFSFGSFLRDGDAVPLVFTTEKKGSNNMMFYQFMGPFTSATYDPVLILDVCNPNPCLNQGLCTDIGSAQFSCNCPSGYTGSACEKEAPESGSDGIMKPGKLTWVTTEKKVRLSLRDDPNEFLDLYFDSWTETGCTGEAYEQHSVPNLADFSVAYAPIASSLKLEGHQDDSDAEVTVPTTMTKISIKMSQPGDGGATFGKIEIEMHEVLGGPENGAKGSLQWLGERVPLREGDIKFTVRVTGYQFNQCTEVLEPDVSRKAQSAQLVMRVLSKGKSYNLDGASLGTDTGHLLSFSSFLKDGQSAPIAVTAAESTADHVSLMYEFTGPFTTAVYDPVLSAEYVGLEQNSRHDSTELPWILTTSVSVGSLCLILMVACISVACCLMCFRRDNRDNKMIMHPDDPFTIPGEDPFTITGHPIHDCHSAFPEAQSFRTFSQASPRRGSRKSGMMAPGIYASGTVDCQDKASEDLEMPPDSPREEGTVPRAV